MISIQRILGQALRDPVSFSMLRGALTSSLAVANPYHRQLVVWAGEFVDKYKTLPKLGDWEFYLATLVEPTKSGIEGALGEVLNLPPEDWNTEYIAVEVIAVLKAVATRSAVARLGTMVPDVPPDALAALQDEIDKIEPVTIHGLKAMKDVGMWIYQTRDDEAIVSTGFEGLDRYTGGFRSELVFILADAGIGKTTILINFGKNAALRGAVVLHVTFELSAENTLRRYYRSTSESLPSELRNSPEIVMDKVNHWLRFAKGSVHVLYKQPYTVGTEELENIVDQFTLLHGKPDLVILDYLDLMKMPPRMDPYEGLGRLSHGVRGIGLVRKATTMSATQATRGAHQVRHIRLDQMGDSYKKVQAADIIITYNQTAEEFEANQGRFGLPKVRESPGRGVEIPVYTNFDIMVVADLDSPNTRRLMEKFRHPTTSVFVQ